MRLASAKFGYQMTFDKSQQEALSKAFMVSRPTFTESGEYLEWYTPVLVDLDKLPQWVGKVEVDQFHTTPEIEELATRNNPVINKVVNVVVPDSPLFQMNEVKLLQDCCTDFLQQELDAGWRIISICPQPDQRRPDYVLGRVNPNGQP